MHSVLGKTEQKYKVNVTSVKPLMMAELVEAMQRGLVEPDVSMGAVTVKHQTAAMVLARGGTWEEAAAESGISFATIGELSKTPAFSQMVMGYAAQLERRRLGRIMQLQDKLLDASLEAADQARKVIPEATLRDVTRFLSETAGRVGLPEQKHAIVENRQSGDIAPAVADAIKSVRERRIIDITPIKGDGDE